MTENWTEIPTSWQGEMAFFAENEKGGKVQMGSLAETPTVGPMQLLLAALGGCTGMDIISILKKKRIKIDDMKVNVSGKRAVDVPMIWEEIEINSLIWGSDLKTKDIEQAIHLSEDKYCSVGIMLGKSANIKSSYRLLEPGETLD